MKNKIWTKKNIPFYRLKEEHNSYKVAFVANTSWSMYNLRRGVLRALKKAKIKIYVIAPYDTFSEKLVKEGFYFIPVKMDNKGINVFKDLNLVRQLHKIYKKEAFDFIFHYTVKPNVYGAIAAKLLSIRSIAVVAGAGQSFLKRGVLFNIAKLLYTLSSYCSERTWFLNKDDESLFITEKITKKQKTNVLPSEGIDTTHFYFSSMERDDSKVIFLLASRLIWAKGIKEYIEAAKYMTAKYENLQFNILGFVDVKNAQAVEENYIEQAHNNSIIQYLGFVEDIRPFILDADCFVLPSFYREGVPRSLLEAASMGRPIITTDNVGCRDVVEDGINGFLCKPQSTTDLISKMEQFIVLSKLKRAQMGMSGREKVLQMFDEKFVFQYYLEALSVLK